MISIKNWYKSLKSGKKRYNLKSAFACLISLFQKFKIRHKNETEFKQSNRGAGS